MTSQPLVASVCVDYLSHPLSAEHLLVCYQQITRQIAHAPQSAKDAATSFQHQSQELLHLLGHHQILALPTAEDRPAPVGCQSQLKRMQNALWRRSSQSSLAKDVALVHPESLNWQKECDVLWLYGPLYEIDFLQRQHEHQNELQQHQRKGPGHNEWVFEQLDLLERPQKQHHRHERVNFHGTSAVLATPQSPPQSPPAQAISHATSTDTQANADSKAEAEEEAATMPSITLATSATSSAPSTTVTAALTPVATETRATTATTTSTPAIIPIHPLSTEPASQATAAAISSTTAEDPSPGEALEKQTTRSEAEVSLTITNTPTNIPTSASNTPPEACSNALLRPTKSALKQQGTRAQVFEELRAFSQSQQYQSLTKSLAIFFESNSSAVLPFAEGTQSEPISPISTSSPAFLLPIFSAPTKYHFRSHDRRRASFPKSASHPSHLNVNVNVNMSVNMQLNGTGGEGSPCNMVSAKQLRFSLEVQELVFLPTSPPFRISRAKPTRAHSDPAIQTATCSSFIAPSHFPSTLPYSIHAAPGPHREYERNGSLISTAAASASFENTTTTFIKVQAQDSRMAPSKTSAARLYLQQDDDEDLPECDFNDDFHDEYLFEDCREGDDDEDEEDDEYNGVGTGHHRHHRFRLSAKDAIVARRVQTDDHRRAQPGVLWQVYTAVTGMKELIAWYGSMVYHSSSL